MGLAKFTWRGLVLASVMLCSATPAAAVGSAFTYQGNLVQNGTPTSDTCDFRFDLYDASVNGGGLGIQTKSSVTVTDGNFTIPDLDFGAAAFDGSERWLEMRVRCPAGSGAFSDPFTPRQHLNAVPYSLYTEFAANVAEGAVNLDSIDFASGNIDLSNSTPDSGNVLKQGNRFLHNYGTNNVFLGLNSGNFSLTGSGGNSAVGHGALSSLTTGRNNTALGQGALTTEQSGEYNTAIGAGAMTSHSSGNDNTAIGRNALSALGTGINNIAIGNLALSNLTSGNHNIAIDSTGVANESQTIRIGTPGRHAKIFVAGIRGATTGAANATAVMVDGFGQLGTISSSRSVKRDIEDLRPISKKVMSLRPVSFHYKRDIDPTSAPQYGLIAEEVAQVFPELVVYGNDGKPETVRYHLLSVLLLDQLQQQNTQLSQQADRIQQLQSRLDRLEQTLRPIAAR